MTRIERRFIYPKNVHPRLFGDGDITLVELLMLYRQESLTGQIKNRSLWGWACKPWCIESGKLCNFFSVGEP